MSREKGLRELIVSKTGKTKVWGTHSGMYAVSATDPMYKVAMKIAEAVSSERVRPARIFTKEECRAYEAELLAKRKAGR
jgi:hypothetical protein